MAAVLVVVDAANVVGSVPDGWWRDRAGATARLRDRLAAVATRGLPDAVPARVRLRDHRRLADLIPRPARRAAPEPRPHPRRVPTH